MNKQFAVNRIYNPGGFRHIQYAGKYIAGPREQECTKRIIKRVLKQMIYSFARSPFDSDLKTEERPKE